MVRASEEYGGDLRELARMRGVVADVCRRAWGVAAGDEAVGRLTLAVHEAASNIMDHAYDGDADGTIEFVVEADADQARATLRHRGRDFDPGAAAPPAFDGSRERGFGLYLIRRAADEVSFFRDADGRCCASLVVKRRRS